MKKRYDEPKYIDVRQADHSSNEQALKLIKQLCQEQSFAVLSTQGNQECYSSLISFVTSPDFCQLAFATPINTRKLDFIKANQRVSVLIDNRANNPDSINDIVAVTVMGKAKMLTEQAQTERWAQALIAKHGYLENFIQAPTTAIVLIDVAKYHFVSSFQAVVAWTPGEHS